MNTLKTFVAAVIMMWASAAAMKPIALFSPTDQPAKKMLELIWKAQKSIYMAMYFFTDRIIADTLIEAKKAKNIDIKVVVDPLSAENRSRKAKYLADHGIEVFVFNPDAGRKKPHFGKATVERWSNEPIMHNKYIIIDDKILWTGSLNATEKANNDNCENVLVLENRELCAKYRDNFILLLAGSFAYAVQDTDDRQQSVLRQKISNLMSTIKDDTTLVTALMSLAQAYNAEEAVGG